MEGQQSICILIGLFSRNMITEDLSDFRTSEGKIGITVYVEFSSIPQAPKRSALVRFNSFSAQPCTAGVVHSHQRGGDDLHHSSN